MIEPLTTDESVLWMVLAEEGLADFAQFHKTGWFDESPLYSRESQIENFVNTNVTRTSIRFALKLLRSIIAYESHRTPYLAAVTVWDLGEPIVPNLFIHSGSIRRLQDKLVLRKPKTPFSKDIGRLVSGLRMPDKFTVLEDTIMTRVFIGPAQSPYPSFVTINQFVNYPRP